MTEERMQETMLAAFYRKNGSHKVDEVDQFPKPSSRDLRPGDLLLKVHSASLNPIDYKQRKGDITKYLIPPSFPVMHGFDFVGTVMEIGKVGTEAEAGDAAAQDALDTTFQVGDKVFGMIQGLEKGSLAEYMVAAGSVCVKAPSEKGSASVSDLEAASIPLVGITSVKAFRACGLKEDDPEGKQPRVLILGGAGGVGTCAIQLARNLYKASFIATTASAGKKTELCTSLGADLVVNYREDKQLKALDDVDPFDVIFDTVGSVKTALGFLKEGGKVCSIGAHPTCEAVTEFLASSGIKKLPFGVRSFLFSKGGKFIVNNAMGSASIRRKLAAKKGTYNYVIGTGSREIMQLLKAQLEEGKLKAVIDQVYELQDARKAIEHLEAGHAAGKVVISVDASQ